MPRYAIFIKKGVFWVFFQFSFKEVEEEEEDKSLRLVKSELESFWTGGALREMIWVIEAVPLCGFFLFLLKLERSETAWKLFEIE